MISLLTAPLSPVIGSNANFIFVFSLSCVGDLNINFYRTTILQRLVARLFKAGTDLEAV